MATLHSTADQAAAPTLSSDLGVSLDLVFLGVGLCWRDVQVGSVELEMIRRLCRRRMLVIMTLSSVVSRCSLVG